MPDALVELVQHALALAARLAIPALAGGAVAAVLGGLLQNLTAWQDGALTHVPRVVAVGAAYALAAPWIAEEMVAFARLAWGHGP
jgi:flagellar biosynthetic protein FliQ